MNVRLYARRTPERATMWFWDWFAAILILLLGVVASAALWKHIPAWVAAALPATCIVTRRIRITRDEPSTGREMIFWMLVIPVRRARFDARAVAAAHSDDWSGDADAPRDSIEAGPWSLSCRRPDEVAAWIRTSSAELSTPRAEVRA